MRKLHRYLQNKLFGRAQIFKPVVLVTGCASGVGLALAHLLWRETEYRVVVTAREKSKGNLEAQGFVENDRFWIRGLDVNSSEDRKNLLEEINKFWGGVNILINNAGICVRSVLEHMTEEAEIMSLRTNYVSAVSLIREVLPKMREHGRGKIINVSSVSGILGMPTMMSYSASKHALEGASESLWYELKPFGVSVTIVQPGFIHSNSVEKVALTLGAERALKSTERYSDYYQSMAPFVNNMMNMSTTTPLDVAETIIRVIRTQNPPLRVSATHDALVFELLRRWVPDRILNPLIFGLLPNAEKWAKGFSSKR